MIRKLCLLLFLWLERRQLRKGRIVKTFKASCAVKEGELLRIADNGKVY